jgi:HD-GYP domain-containing protein (c-di-GMP phosphodiesterase class II)
LSTANTESKKCRRTACQNPHDECIHSMTKEKYCRSCAHKINRANPEYPNLIRIPISALIGTIIDDTFLTRRITDMAMGAYGGEFNSEKTFGEQEGFDSEPAMFVKLAVSKTSGIPLADLPKMKDMKVHEFAEAVKAITNAPLKDDEYAKPTSEVSAEVQGIQAGPADERRESREGS